ncbi:MAG TPA: CehA/McbA family metallohydrolase [Thermoleophilaceae bacterium]|nr:CehA/McbA family metallohydrolase [Thermoleophilaceae bacterium]
MGESFSIAQVTPYPWEQGHDVNRYVERVSAALRERGHRVVIVAPADSRKLVREGRARVKRIVAGDQDALFDGDVLAVGQSLPFRRGRAVALPIDVSRTLEDLLEHAELDFVHVHEPFAPSAASAALRHSRTLNVGTFHGTTERFLSTQVARRVVQLLFGRLDARTATSVATRDLVDRFFPGHYAVVPPGADLIDAARTGGPTEILYSADEDRGALRVLLRALRKLPAEADWTATIWLRDPAAVASPLQLPRRLRDRVRLAGPADGTEAEHLARADIVVAASTGVAPSSQLVLRALGAGAVPVVSNLPQYAELLDDGELGLLFDPRDAIALGAQLERLVSEPNLLAQLTARIAQARDGLSWSRAVDEFEAIYATAAARRHDPVGKPAVRKRLADRKFVHVDLHMHTDHSSDCATPAATLLEAAKAAGLDKIAITDHNEVSGAHEARALAEEIGGIEVIVAEEVKTADQGEVIGLFIEEKIPKGLTLEQTIAEIRAQGGLVYVPHPFDRMHSVPDYENLLAVVEDVDAIEVFNPRVAFSTFNEEAARFAEKYRIVAGAGSDSHVAAGLGSVKIRMRDFDGPEEFLESLRDADIVRKKQSLLYVQALKFIQTRATPEAARRRTAKPGAGAARAENHHAAKRTERPSV